VLVNHRLLKKQGKSFQIGHSATVIIMHSVCFQNSPLYWSMVDAGLEKVGEEDVHKNTDTSSMGTELHTTKCNKVFHIHK